MPTIPAPSPPSPRLRSSAVVDVPPRLRGSAAIDVPTDAEDEEDDEDLEELARDQDLL